MRICIGKAFMMHLLGHSGHAHQTLHMRMLCSSQRHLALFIWL